MITIPAPPISAWEDNAFMSGMIAVMEIPAPLTPVTEQAVALILHYVPPMATHVPVTLAPIVPASTLPKIAMTMMPAQRMHATTPVSAPINPFAMTTIHAPEITDRKSVV